MSEKITCGIVRDLLPLYADGVTGDESRALVEAHLAECAACREELEELKKPVALPPEGDKKEELKRWRRTWKRSVHREALTAALLLAAALLLLAFPALMTNIGVPAGKIEADARRSGAAAEYPLLSQAVNGEIGLLLFQKGETGRSIDIYVNREGFDFGYHFRYGSSEPAQNRVYAVTYRNSLLVFSLTADSGAARIELTAEPGGGPGTVYAVTPGEYFAVILPLTFGAEDAALQVLDGEGHLIPVSELVL